MLTRGLCTISGTIPFRRFKTWFMDDLSSQSSSFNSTFSQGSEKDAPRLSKGYSPAWLRAMTGRTDLSENEASEQIKKLVELVYLVSRLAHTKKPGK